MKPGPDLIKACPKCGKHHSYFTLLSGNTFNRIVYSDTKSILPYNPQHPPFYQCSACDALFETQDAISVESSNQNGVNASNGEPYPEFKTLGPDEFLLLKDRYSEGINKLAELAKLFCVFCHHAFNDRTRAGKPIFVRPEDEANYRAIVFQLIHLLDNESENDLILIGELYRNIGEFDNAIKCLNKITSPHMQRISKQILSAAQKGERQVFRLDLDEPD